jgi:DNA-directed RNA polymerase subunit RPC12/RpoP
MRRRCFLPPIPEYTLCADLLSRAADALLAKDMVACERYLREADLRPLREFAYRICGPINLELHRQSKNPVYARAGERSGPRMPSTKVEHQIYTRDGHRCRYCSSRVVLKEARKAFVSACPTPARWGRTNEEKHFGLATLTASIDHVRPIRRGGDNDPHNLVTACGPCQFGRNQWTLEEVEIEDPRNYPALVDGWDGLSRLTVPIVHTKKRP